MKNLIFRLILPLTIISFVTITKWWYGNIVDGTDEFFYGFPFIYKCRGFHTSLSTQYFLTEMMFNFIVYFAFWCIIILTINKYWSIKISKLISRIFWIVFGFLSIGFVYLSYEFNDRYFIKRDFEVRILESGFSFLELHSKDRKKYQLHLKKESNQKKK